MTKPGISIWYVLAVVLLVAGCSGVGSPSSSTSSQIAGASPSSVVLPTPVATTADGSANAPTALAQFPNMFHLNGYATRPTWFVAGVDYAVGIPSGTTLQDPATIVLTGVTVDSTHHIVYVDAPNITLDSYDFSLDGGWEVEVGANIAAANVSIIHSNFKIGSNGLPTIFGAPGASNLYVGYCIIDGNDKSDSFNGTSITMNGSGLTAEYNWFKNNTGGGIDVGGGGTVILRYNVFENLGLGKSMQPFWLQLGGSNYAVTTIYNTTYQPATTNGSSSGGFQIVIDNSLNSSQITSGEVGNNTMVALANAGMSFLVSVDTSQLAGPVTVHDNFADISGAQEFALSGSSGGDSSFTNNVNLTNGQTFPTNP